ncbi:MAG TPA: branched-chain amino acid ABC transporter ATP-binding protein [Desulfosporosinus sp.]|nr:branched-chain amino acid ABC transporter ATP-binding protein [Desulfosporosinus sp.]
MEVRGGELVSLVGANGAGKTTVLKTISGLVKAKSGECRFMGENISGLEPHEIVARGLIQVPEGRKLFPGMTVLENLELGAYSKEAKKDKKKNLEYVFSMLPDLMSKNRNLAGSLSGGQQQMLAIGRGLMSSPKLLVLDEPSIGLSPLLTKTMFDIIAKIKLQGVTLLLVEQNVNHALGMADRGYVIEQGRIVMNGPAKNLLHDEHLKKAYLGM